MNKNDNIKKLNKQIDIYSKKYLEDYLLKSGRSVKEKFLCIKHNDHNPSMFYITNEMKFNSQNVGKCYCRTCHQFFNVIDFIMYDKALARMEAIKDFVKEYEINLDEEITLPEDKEEPEEEIELQEELFSNDYKEKLLANIEGDFKNSETYQKYFEPLSNEDFEKCLNGGGNSLIDTKIDLQKYGEIFQQIKNHRTYKQHFEERGLSNTTIEKYLLTKTIHFNDLMNEEDQKENEFSKDFDNCFIFPFLDHENKFSYFIGEPEQRKVLEDKGFKQKYIKPRGKAILFNERYLQNNDEEVIFLCEGIFDTLSIEEMGEKSIALLSNYSTRLKKLLLKLQPRNKIFVLMLDNDEGGEQGEKKLCEFLKENSFKYYSIHENKKHIQNVLKGQKGQKGQNFLNILKDTKDTNELLMKDKETLQILIDEVLKETQKMKNKDEELKETTQPEEDKKILEQINTKNRIEAFFEKVETGVFKPTPTQFKNLDKALEGGFSSQSIITIGGGSNTGKTTLAINLSLKLAQTRPVIYYTLENSQEQILSKVFSHLSKAKGGMRISSSNFLKAYDKNIMTEYQQMKVKECLKECEELNNFFVIFPKSATLKDLIKNVNLIKEECLKKGLPSPCLVLDYIQFLQGEVKEDEMTLIKKTQRALKEYVIKNNSIAFIITANNRGSNGKQETRIDSGRGTSDLEYSSDYNLQINFFEYEHKGKKKEEDLPSRTELIRKNPRKMSLTIQKQRFGQSGLVIDFMFDGISNTFTELEEKKKEPEEEPFPDYEEISFKK